MSQDTKIEEVNVYTDGASRGNPGEAAIGIYICDTDNNAIKEISKYIGTATNNFAEYTALIEALKACLKIGAKKINIFMDSQLVVRQMLGEYRVKNENIKPLYEKVVVLKAKFDDFKIKHIRREFNKKADALANEAF